jgi:PKD repeat protein
MKKITFLSVSILLITLSFNAFSQQSFGGLPLSYTSKSLTPEIDHVIITPPNMEQVMAEVELFDKNGQIYKIAEPIPTEITMENSGTWDFLSDGTKIWRLKISSREAKGLALYYRDFYLPEHTQLFLFNENRRQLIGSFDYRNNPTLFSDFSTEMIQGESVYLELIQSPEATESANIDIYQVSYIFRGVTNLLGRYEDYKPTGGVGSSGTCEVNVNCPEGANWQTQKKGVAEYFTSDGGLCSGTIVNNTAQDGKAYFLTADHCGGDGTNFTGWQFYFNYEATGCTNPGSEPAYNTITGATKRARGDANTGSDFLLLELTTTSATLATYNVYYNGWDRSTTGSASGVSIHHPSGDIKKISTYTTTLVPGTFNSCPANAHWKAVWVSTVTNWGVTEGGSSGSPLFSAGKLVVGTLSGGLSACGVPATQANDLYGKFDYHWLTNGATAADQLKPWLDPGNTGAMTCPGWTPGSAAVAPVAAFSGTPTTVVVGGTVAFTDLSTNTPTSWSWTFAGGTPATSTTQNPLVVYNTPGTYTVTLTVTNAAGTDTETITTYITVVAAGTLTAAFSGTPLSVAAGGTVTFTDESIGSPTTWSWSFPGGTPATSTLQNPSVVYSTAGVYSVTLTVGNGTTTDDVTRTNYITVTGGSAGDLVAALVASDYDFMAGTCINFNDISTGGPTQWAWSFPGATTTSSTNQNPTNICYPNPGVYDVILEVQNGTGQDTYICVDCLTVTPDPTLPIANFSANILTVPVGGVVHFTNLSQNGPFNQWAWAFEGGTPAEFADSAPPPIAYMTVGTYDVELRCRKTNNIQDIEIKYDYIRVIPQATVPPVANFTANYTVIEPGDAINFIDLSTGNPYNWTWTFEGGSPATSNQQNPTGIIYATAGTYNVTLTVSNNLGEDVLLKEQYIVVSATDPCSVPPVVDFTANPRLISAGESVYFQDLSTEYPTVHTWSFPGGTPSFSSEGSPTTPIRYNTPGIYNVTLTVSNGCGATSQTKERYIYVFSGSVQSYCDTMTNIIPGEVVEPRVPASTWGFIAGQNGDNIKGYADYFTDYTFSQIRGLIVPVSFAVYGSYSSYVTFYVWNGAYPTPDSILGQKKVYLRDLTQNQANTVLFDSPVTIEGPFYIGYKINYPDENSDGISDDLFVVGIAAPRGNNPTNNNLFMLKSGVWKTCNEQYSFSSALCIKPMTCLVDIEQLIAETSFNLYPNPSNGIATIQVLDESIKDFTIEIYDVLGRKFDSELIYSGMSEYNLNLNSCPDGMYIIRINTGKNIINKKLLLSK